MKLFYLLLGILAAGLILLILNHDGGRWLGIENNDFERLVSLSAIAVMLAAGVLHNRFSFGQTLRQIMIWLVIILALAAGYIYRNDLSNIGDRLAGGLIPGRMSVFTDSEGQQEVVLHKVLNGHFESPVTINGETVHMLVDTGASTVAISWDDAEKLGLKPETLDFTQTVMTANGNARAAPVTLSEVAIGPIVRQDIRASVAEKGKLDQSLLGMSFLSTLDFLQMQTDELRLRD